MSDKPHYRKATSMPLTLAVMAAVMTAPPKPVLDPVTIAGQKALQIYRDLKWKVSMCDGQPLTIHSHIHDAIERAKTEILVETIRDKTVAQFEAMLKALPDDS